MKKQLQSSIYVLFLTFLTFSLFAQPCGSDAPQTYEAIPDASNPGQCFLIITWGAEMSKLECGNPGSPATGSTVPNNRKLADLSLTINGNLVTLYDKSGGNCNGAIADLAYGADPNTYITTYSSTAFCDAGNISSTHVDGNQTGATAINCDMTNANLPVPVVLENFHAEVREEKVQLYWQTSSEENTAYFMIERSWQGHSFHSLQKISAAGFSHSRKSYSWEDQNGASSIYYRLKIVDYDGSVDYSPVILVNQDQVGLDAFKLFPSPVKEELQLSIELAKAEILEVNIFNLSGQLLQTEYWDGQSGKNHKALLVSDLPNQLLVVQVKGLTSYAIKKVWKR